MGSLRMSLSISRSCPLPALWTAGVPVSLGRLKHQLSPTPKSANIKSASSAFDLNRIFSGFRSGCNGQPIPAIQALVHLGARCPDHAGIL